VGFHQWGYPKLAGWVISWKIPIYKWMMTGGTPISGNLHINNGNINNTHGDIWGYIYKHYEWGYGWLRTGIPYRVVINTGNSL